MNGIIFASRWLLAPLYIGLAASLVLVLISFVRKFADLGGKILTMDANDVIIGVLSLIDMSLLANLVLIVMFAGYRNFVARLGQEQDWDTLAWIGHVDWSDLKLKLIASIVAISAIGLLEDFMHIDDLSNRQLSWSVGIHVTFVFSGVMMALMDLLGQTKPR